MIQSTHLESSYPLDHPKHRHGTDRVRWDEFGAAGTGRVRLAMVQALSGVCPEPPPVVVYTLNQKSVSVARSALLFIFSSRMGFIGSLSFLA